MAIRTIDLQRGDVPAAIQDAASRIREGGLIIVPTETVYGLAGSAASVDALARLRTVRGLDAAPDSPPALHLPSVDALLSAAPGLASAHRRLVRRLAPGPVAFLIPLDDDASGALHERCGVPDDAARVAGEILLRVPGDRWCREVVEAARSPVAIAPACPASAAPPHAAEDAVAGFERAGAADQIALALDAGPSPLRKPSTVIRLLPHGQVEVVRSGAYEERFIHKQLRRMILFVCSGNTCRSPMAAALARHALRTRPRDGGGGDDVVVESAGVGAMAGAPATDEARQAMERLGVEMGPHASRPLSREQINRAEAIFAMTQAQAAAVREIAPDAANRLQLLDPEGQDVPDPVGASQDVYDETARRLRDLIARRLEELEL